ncbi:MAG: IS200/IS605 family accessory protein TnpB-related protein [Dolichospermum sp.]
MLNTDIAQQTLKVVDRTFRSFYGLITSVKSGSYSQKIRLPHYLPKEGYFPLIIPRVNRNAKVRDYLNKAARYVINHCIEHRIDKLVIGFNIEMKQSINIGSRNNQNFVQIPHSSFRFKLKALCERYGIKYVEQEESYPSKASFLDDDNIPVFNADNPKKYEFSGKRIKRGLYRTQFGILVNADCNGAANILVKK